MPENITSLTDKDLISYYNLYLKMNNGSKRAEKVKIQTFDCKYALHLVRLLDEVEQILVHGDIDLQKNKEQLKAIRRGDITEKEIRQWASDKSLHLENVYAKSTLREKPDVTAIKNLLLKCLEIQYGSLDKAVVVQDQYQSAFMRIKEIIEEVK
jgi:hypothetical protein